MGVLLYNVFLFLFKGGVHIASLFNSKAKKWKAGRKNIFRRLDQSFQSGGKVIWMHCASLGEFEQGRPLLEKLKSGFPSHKILLTFFSPSGYEVQKNYPGADYIFYLPADGSRNAKRFLDIVDPALVIFVKYEFWYYYLHEIESRKIPLLLVSALFRNDTVFFKWYGGLYRKILSRFDHLFVQNDSSRSLLENIGLGPITTVSGDTRFDRVIEISEKFEPIATIENFVADKVTIVAGSTWKEDEEILQIAFDKASDPALKLILAPHEINEGHMAALKALFPGCILYSELSKQDRHPSVSASPDQPKVLIIDNIGMLSRLYKYGSISYVGGGLKKSGVHNVLEAAVYNKPVIMGPFYEEYAEAVALVESGGANVIKDEKELTNAIINLLQNADGCYDKASIAAGNYVWRNRGASEKIIRFIQENRLLTI